MLLPQIVIGMDTMFKLWTLCIIVDYKHTKKARVNRFKSFGLKILKKTWGYHSCGMMFIGLNKLDTKEFLGFSGRQR